MTSLLFSPVSTFVSCPDCQAVFDRLIGNIGGFVYRRRHDARWTMEFISAACRDITGYDPHRFIENESLAWAELIAPGDRKRVESLVRAAVEERRRATVDYLIRAAHGLWVHVEDRFAPVFDDDGRVIAIEGVIDRCCISGAVAAHVLPNYSAFCDRFSSAQPTNKAS